jgi:hypothetical protein
MERAILSMLPFRELGRITSLCKNMRAVIVAHVELRHHLDWQHPGATVYLSAAVALMARCRQLRVMDMRYLSGMELYDLLLQLVRDNAASLREVHVAIEFWTPALLLHLSLCPRLAHFRDVSGLVGYTDAALRVFDRCKEVRCLSCSAGPCAVSHRGGHWLCFWVQLRHIQIGDATTAYAHNILSRGGRVCLSRVCSHFLDSHRCSLV